MADSPPFATLGRLAQINRLRKVAAAALSQYPIDVTSFRVIDYSFNATFRVDTVDGRRFALRLNVNSRRELAWIEAEVAWVNAIAADTDLDVAIPLPTIDGRLLVTVESADLGRPIPAVLYSWLPGRNIGSGGNIAQLWEVGRSLAVLHDHAESWTLPAGADLPLINDTLMREPKRWGTSGHPLLTAERQAVLDAGYADCQRHEGVFDGPVIPIHADIHRHNLKWYRGRLSIFDFDDCGFGVPAQDFAIAAYYLRDETELEAALLDGYQTVRSLPSWTDQEYEAMVLGRNLLLVNAVLTWESADAVELLESLIPLTVQRVEHYVECGRFHRWPPGVNR